MISCELFIYYCPHQLWNQSQFHKLFIYCLENDNVIVSMDSKGKIKLNHHINTIKEVINQYVPMDLVNEITNYDDTNIFDGNIWIPYLDYEK